MSVFESELLKNSKIRLLFYVSKLLFPFYESYTFPLYLLIRYYNIKRQNKVQFPKLINCSTLSENEEDIWNNAVLINNIYLKRRDFGLLQLRYKHKIFYRYVKFIFSESIPKDEIHLTSSLVFNCMNYYEVNNCFLDDFLCNIKVSVRGKLSAKIAIAQELEVALVHSPNELIDAALDTVIKNFFATPKIIHPKDIIKINLRKYGTGLELNPAKTKYCDSIYLTCKNIYCKEQQTVGYFVVIGETTIKQCPNVQSFVPPLSPLHPTGLQKYADQLHKAVKPFLTKRFDICPTFLLLAKKGSGKEILVRSVCSKLGLHFYKVTNAEVTAQVYIQNETKLRNVFFHAKLSAPCIVYLENFENFEKNNDGQTDERIISYFTSELRNLFLEQEYPVILFCGSNVDNISARLKKEFIEIFKIEALTQDERLANLYWLIDRYDMKVEADLVDVAAKTNGYLFEDLEALVTKAVNWSNTKCDSLDDQCFTFALDYMQSNYNESLGAPRVPKVQWDDVGGLNDVKNEIIKTISYPIKHPNLFKATGIKRFGILLFGPPGTGKTLLAKAVATECNLCFLSVKGPELLNMYIGQSEENIREVFERARAASPCIIFFDELDSLAPNRGASGDSGGVMDRVVSQLLAEMDGLNEKATVFIIGATNRPDLIDPALLRPGRFDKLLYVGPSLDDGSRLSVLKALTRKFTLAADVNLEEITKICPNNVSGADFYGICSNSWMNAVRRLIDGNDELDVKKLRSKDVVVNFTDFEKAIASVKPSITATDLKYYEQLRQEISLNKS